jgi:hypothetical protein
MEPAVYKAHVFRSSKFQSVVEEAIKFFETTPICQAPPESRFMGCGVYALYYVGDYELYAGLVRRNKTAFIQPIYVGKAVPRGWRTARAVGTFEATDLYRRLREHARSIEQVENLNLVDFRCRFVILRDVETDLVVPVEAALIRKYKPLWNSGIDGFGNHDPGAGRYNQARSEWDVLHPGRPWAEKLTGESLSIGDVVAKVKQFQV